MKKTVKILFVIVILAVSLVLMNACLISGLDNGSGRLNDTNQDPGGQNEVDTSYKDSEVNFQIVTPPPTEGKTLADTIEEIYNSVVVVEAATSGGTSLGSGVIVSAEEDNAYSYIITCHHVVDGASSIRVILENGKEYKAIFVGGAPDEDVAVLKIADKKDITFAYIRNTAEAPVRLGEDVIAIGNPLGTLGGTVTKGIISSTSRTINVEGNSMNLIQTDASINSGNSGGALFDVNGLLIGIINAKYAGEDIEGLGFAIPIDKAAAIAADLIRTSNDKDNAYGGFGYVPGKFKLGVLISQQTDYSYKIVETYSYATFSNLLSAEQIITSINSKTFSKTVSLAGELAKLSIGDSVTLGIKYPVVQAGTTVYAQKDVTATLKQYVYGYNQ